MRLRASSESKRLSMSSASKSVARLCLAIHPRYYGEVCCENVQACLYQLTVSPMACLKGVALIPKDRSKSEWSTTNGSSNS